MIKINRVIYAPIVVALFAAILSGCEKSGKEWLIGAIILSFIIFALVSAFFIKSRKTEKRLEELVTIRTNELQLLTSELGLQTALLHTMLDSIPNIVFCKDLNSTYTLCNKYMIDFFNLDKDDIIGKGDMDGLGMPAKLAEAIRIVDINVITEGKIVTFEEWIPSIDGKERLFETVKAPLIQNGSMIGLIGIAHDITERKAMEEEAKAASRSKSAFLANMNHEMRTPMNVIVGITDLMLEEDDLAANLKDNLKKINASGNTLLRLISDVLDFSKIEAGKIELMPVQYEMASFLNDIITVNMLRIKEKPITFLLDIDKDLPYSLYGDDLRVKQIIDNLLSNAFKYTQKGSITFGMNCERDSGGDVWMSAYVSDTGIGIRQEDLKKLFTDYNQVDTLANRNMGTGLGLSITKMLVEHMDGEISVESEYGKGAIFRFRIRQQFVSNETIGAETAENLRSFHYAKNRPTAGKKLIRPNLGYAKVLVVDDMQANLDVTAALLGKYKIQVDCVTNGQKAVDRINNGEPIYDAIFMDHMMPEMDGVETTEKIRSIGTKYAIEIPIIALTANAIAGNEQMFFKKDFQAFLTKPINIIKLDSVVQKWVRDISRE